MVAAAVQAIGAAREAAVVSAVAVDAAGASRIGSVVVGAVPAGTVGETVPAASILESVVLAVV